MRSYLKGVRFLSSVFSVVLLLREAEDLTGVGIDLVVVFGKAHLPRELIYRAAVVAVGFQFHGAGIALRHAGMLQRDLLGLCLLYTSPSPRD